MGSYARDPDLHLPQPVLARCPSAVPQRDPGGHTVHIAPGQMLLFVVPKTKCQMLELGLWF